MTQRRRIHEKLSIKSLTRLRLKRIKLTQGTNSARLPKVTPARMSVISRSLKENPIASNTPASNAPQSVASDIINDITTHLTDKDKCQTSTMIDEDISVNLSTTSTVKIH